MNTIEFFKALSDETRLRCLSLLVNKGELCVCELTYALNLSQPKISHHLAKLRKAQLVSDRKEGLWIYYRINNELSSWFIEILEATAKGIENDKPFITDKHTLATMPE
ncbi:MAG: metalloregulator ArsR/SmtB family transcription factor [gamma proteobacterium symbiont of Lucinoma myriamae]|nr:metalloregulator ArsR/SmtB family transcription factor [gamma proteobacterium symbiont of Lucinoma myriamae]MCU7819268.1 metalloregulator ArsR/SmtB family transcription factor [gamma proteobacterium symbiont of Lucinoma myriamae]MCU7832749.1 metalloregulator ArsR/SmtB family transcription factor [gamma proteobacterium symbiont of Lucinoma myriamae]